MSRQRQNSRNWTEQFKFVYDLFCSSAYGLGLKATNRDFCAFLDISSGKFQNWSNGQWPSADDLQTLHSKLGLSYAWLVSGEGDPFGDAPQKHEAIPQEEISKLREDLEEERRINRQLVAKLFVDGVGDKPEHVNTAKTVDGAK